MSRFLLSGIRTRLILFFSFLLIPCLILITYRNFEQRKRAIERTRGLAESVYGLAVTNEQLVLQETQEILSRLSVNLNINDPESCAVPLTAILKSHPEYVIFGVAGANGDVLCSTRPFDGPVNVADRSYFRNAVREGVFSPGTYQMGRITGRYSVNYGYPILEKGREDIAGVVFAARDVSSLTEYEAKLFPFVPPGSTFAKIDAAGTVLGNYPDSPDFPVGKSLEETFFRRISSGGKGSITLSGPDGVERLYFFSPLGTMQWGEDTYVLLGIPVGSLMAEADRDLSRNLFVLGIAVIVLSVGLWSVGERLVVRPVERIVGASRRLAEGDLTARVGFLAEKDEIGHLGAAFDHMAEELERKTGELERKSARLSEVEARLTHILSASPAVIFACPVTDASVDEKRKYVPRFVSENVKEMFGFNVREIMDPSASWWLDTVHPEDLPGAMDTKRLYTEGRLSREYRVRLGNGDYRWVWEHLVLVRDGAGQPLEAVGSWADVTERKRSEEALVRLSMAVGQSADAIVITDPDGAIEYVNPALERISGYCLEELKGMDVALLQWEPCDEELHRKIWETIRSGKVWKGRLDNRRKDGTLYEIEATVSPVWDASGKIVNYVSSRRDITKESHLQKQIQAAQRMESVGALAGGIAHDFNNVLTGIFGFTEVAMRKAGGNAEVVSCLDEIRRCSERASTLTKQLLAYSRRQIISPINLDMNKVIRDLTKLLEKVMGERIRIRVALGEELPCVHADVGQIEQVLMNLVINARDAMPDGGELLIETGVEELTGESGPFPPEAGEGKHVLLKVTDTGVGMDDKTRERAFDPFFTTKAPEKGSGLGLAMAYGIIKQHKGFIFLDSEIGRGTVFRIYLPAVDAPADEIEKPSAPQARRGSEVLLMAEDDETVRDMAKTALEELGYTVLAARNGREAVELFRCNRERISLVLLDLAMPVLGGREARAEMAMTDPDLKALFMSGYNYPLAKDSFDRGLEAPFLPKPFTLKDLALKVREVLEAEKPVIHQEVRC